MQLFYPDRSRFLITFTSLLVLVGTITWVNRFETLPAFDQFQNVQDKKSAFFEYLLPKIERVNRNIARDRQAALALKSQPLPLHWLDRAKLVQIAHRYGITPDMQTSDQQLLSETLERANVVPASLALIQAAKESGWGTSKFARLANNLFGQQCFTPGCGIVPNARAAGRRHEVQRFVTVQDAVAAYAFNLNSHPRYLTLRQIRSRLDADNQPITGTALAEGLQAYSERGMPYVREIQSMIRQNNLE